jgi:hypothetical protein
MGRSRPLMIAPFIPLWGILAFFGAEQFRGTPFWAPFVAVMVLFLLALFGYVANQTLRAKRMRSGR